MVPESSTKTAYTFCLGGLAFWIFILELTTGILLLLHYVPTSESAYRSVLDITYVVPYGFFIRNLHYWCGQVMVILVLLHMVRVFITRAYAAPRHWNWLIGISLLVGTFLVDFTGYVLIWDDRGLWAWTIARNLAETIPLIGAGIASIVFGPAEASTSTIVRIYIWHIVLIPGLMGILMIWHFWRIRKDGGISKPL